MSTPRTRPNRLGQYADVKEILDQCLQSNGGTYTLPTHGKAVHWRHRAYRFRKLFAETLGPKQMSPYDRLTMPVVPSDSCDVVIRSQTVTGTFVPNISSIEPMLEVARGEDDDPLLAIAADIASKIEKGE